MPSKKETRAQSLLLTSFNAYHNLWTLTWIWEIDIHILRSQLQQDWQAAWKVLRPRELFALSLWWYLPVGWIYLTGPKQERHQTTSLSLPLTNAQSLSLLWNVLWLFLDTSFVLLSSPIAECAAITPKVTLSNYVTHEWMFVKSIGQNSIF